MPITPEVANPAVIIGLGGTGKWVLTYVKKNLLDTYGGKIPSAVRLLSFDTTSEKPSRDGVAQEEDARVGDVQLDKQAEFVYLGGNIYDICRNIRDKGEYPHIGSWLQARAYLQNDNPDAFDISRGAGQKRPFGRMAIFYDLQKAVQSSITNKIETAIREVISANQRQQAIEIYVVASLAGGTGSGMFIDIAHLARWFANRQIRTGFAIRGFLAMHNTFKSVIRTEQIQPQAFAALRELDRFMLVFDQQYPIVYNPSNPVLQTIYGGELGKLFDNCYLLDASREHLPLDNTPPKFGVFPSIADCISMLLDASTGDTYAQHYKNVNTRIANVQSRLQQPLFSSLGTYSLILPVEDIITSLTYRFTTDLLGTYLLDLEQQSNDSGQVQYVLRYEGDAHKDAAALLKTTKSSSGVVSTNFIQRVPNMVDARDTTGAAFIGEIAALDAAELLTWVLPPETDPTVEELARKVREDLGTRLGSRVLASNIEGDDPIEGCDRVIRGVRDFREEHIGRDVGGRRVGGKYRLALEECLKIHRERYRILLREHIVTLLNGPAPENKDYQHEKQGKLGQSQALLAHLALYFADLSAFLGRVKQEREQHDELRSAQEEAGLLLAGMKDKRDKGSFLGMFAKSLHPAIKAQQAYIEAEQQVVDIEINDLFFDFLQQTSEALRSVTEEYKAAVDIWIATLMRGLTGTRTDPGLYRYLQSRADEHAKNREEKTRIVVNEYVTDDRYETSLYEATTDGKFAEVLTRLVWGCEQQSDTFRLTLSGCLPATANPSGGRSSTERNAEFFLGIARSYFTPLRDLTIADRLVEGDSMRLASKLLDKCSPLIRYDPSRTGGEQELHYFVCVNEGRQKAYFNEFRDSLRRLGASAKDNQVLDSSSAYTCTILATADVIASAGLLAYTSAEREYNNYNGDARQLHNFPAEVNAVRLEEQLPKIRESRRRFSPILTAMLEDRRVVELFIRAYIYRFIRLDEADGVNSRWVLSLPSTIFVPGALQRDDDVFRLTLDDRRPSLFQAIESFVFRRSDLINPVQRIDFDLLKQELGRFQDQLSDGDDSRLINFLAMALKKDIDPLRANPDAALRDLGSVMRLEVDEMIQGLMDRLRANGKQYDPSAQPREVNARYREQISERVAQTFQAETSVGLVLPVAMNVTPEPPLALPDHGDPDLANLEKLKKMLASGLISQDQYDAKVQEILSRM